MRKLICLFVFILFSIFSFTSHIRAVAGNAAGAVASSTITTAAILVGTVIKSVLIKDQNKRKHLINIDKNSKANLELKEIRITDKGEVYCVGQANIVSRNSEDVDASADDKSITKALGRAVSRNQIVAHRFSRVALVLTQVMVAKKSW